MIKEGGEKWRKKGEKTRWRQRRKVENIQIHDEFKRKRRNYFFLPFLHLKPNYKNMDFQNTYFFPLKSQANEAHTRRLSSKIRPIL